MLFESTHWSSILILLFENHNIILFWIFTVLYVHSYMSVSSDLWWVRKGSLLASEIVVNNYNIQVYKE